MTAPPKKYRIVTEVIIGHPKVVIAPSTLAEPPDLEYPINPQYPPDPAIYAPPSAIDGEELDRGREDKS